MVDRLRSAAEQLEAPICPDCHIEMKWFRSELLADEPTPIIAHLFLCPHCKRAAQADTVFKSTQAPPGKRAAPRFLARAEAWIVPPVGPKVRSAPDLPRAIAGASQGRAAQARSCANPLLQMRRGW